MYLLDAELEPIGLPLLPSEYVQEIENATAKVLLDRMRSPYAEWEVRDGFPTLVKFDKTGYEAHLRKSGTPAGQIDAYVAALADPQFNERNRRGFDRLRKRLAGCRDVAIKLWGPEQKPLQDVPVGVAMLDYINAGAHPVPKGGNAILMNFGLCFLHDYYILLLQTRQRYHNASPPPDAIDDLTRLAKAIFGDAQNHKEFLTAFPRSLAAEDETKLQSRIKMALACLFILLHEYGHVALGHTDELRKWPRLHWLSASERQKYCAVLRGWEFEADRFALDSLSGKMATPGTPLPNSRLLSMMMSDVFGTMGLAVGRKTTESPDDTHPLPKHRVFKLCGVKDDAEFQEWLAITDEESSGSGAFITEMLVPILVATGAIDDAQPAQ